MLKKLIVLALAAVMIVTMIAAVKAECSHKFEWKTNTAIHAREFKCAWCGVVATRNMSHQYGSATCTTPATCTYPRCNETKGNPLGHLWRPATRTTPKLCVRCGMTVGCTLAR